MRRAQISTTTRTNHVESGRDLNDVIEFDDSSQLPLNLFRSVRFSHATFFLL